MDELNMDCQDVEKAYPYDKPEKIQVEENQQGHDQIQGYNEAIDDLDKYLIHKLDIEILSDVLYHIMTAEGLEFCEKDLNNIAKGIKKWMNQR